MIAALSALPLKFLCKLQPCTIFFIRNKEQFFPSHRLQTRNYCCPNDWFLGRCLWPKTKLQHLVLFLRNTFFWRLNVQYEALLIVRMLTFNKNPSLYTVTNLKSLVLILHRRAWIQELWSLTPDIERPPTLVTSMKYSFKKPLHRRLLRPLLFRLVHLGSARSTDHCFTSPIISFS